MKKHSIKAWTPNNFNKSESYTYTVRHYNSKTT